MAYEVVLPIPKGDALWRRGGGSELLESQLGQLSSGSWFKAIHPRDSLIEWLQEFTPSWVYYHEVTAKVSGSYHAVETVGVVFGFEEAGDAVLFKLTWT